MGLAPLALVLGMSENVQLALVMAAINAAVTWGIITTKMAWLRRDVDSILQLRDALAAKVLKS